MLPRSWCFAGAVVMADPEVVGDDVAHDVAENVATAAAAKVEDAKVNAVAGVVATVTNAVAEVMVVAVDTAATNAKGDAAWALGRLTPWHGRDRRHGRGCGRRNQS